MRNVFLEGILVLFLAISMFGCDRYQNQYSKVISDNETKSTKVDCFTFLGLPLACIQVDKYEKTVELIEIVERIVTQIVTQIEYVQIEKIVREVHAVYSEKEVDIDSIVTEVLGILMRDYPAITAPVSSQRLSEIVTNVTDDVVENAPSVVVNAETSTVTIESPPFVPQNTVPPVQHDESTDDESTDDGEYIVYSHRVNGRIQSGVIHSDHAVIQDGKIFFTGSDGEVDDEDTSDEYIEIETGLTYDEAEERSSKILSE
jgi:hypothetical protein